MPSIPNDIRNSLIRYVMDHVNDTSTRNIIRDFCKQQPPISKTVYRGQQARSTSILPTTQWFSTTLNKEVAKTEFSSGHCCTFTIHLVNVPTININAFIGNEIGYYNEEAEIICLGGGEFYADAQMTKQGQFSEIKEGEYECWYTIASKTSSFDPQKILSQIPEDEYEFISSPKDIVGFNLNSPQQRLVFDALMKRI